MRLFMVTTGTYSDYRVLGVFSSRDKADDFVLRWMAGQEYLDNCTVEELAVDAGVEKDYRKCFHVSLTESGDLFRKWDSVEFVGPRESFEGERWGGCAYVWSAVSEEHAAKLAAERRQSKLRLTKAVKL